MPNDRLVPVSVSSQFDHDRRQPLHFRDRQPPRPAGNSSAWSMAAPDGAELTHATEAV